MHTIKLGKWHKWVCGIQRSTTYANLSNLCREWWLEWDKKHRIWKITP